MRKNFPERMFLLDCIRSMQESEGARSASVGCSWWIRCICRGNYKMRSARCPDTPCFIFAGDSQDSDRMGLQHTSNPKAIRALTTSATAWPISTPL